MSGEALLRFAPCRASAWALAAAFSWAVVSLIMALSGGLSEIEAIFLLTLPGVLPFLASFVRRALRPASYGSAFAVSSIVWGAFCAGLMLIDPWLLLLMFLPSMLACPLFSAWGHMMGSFAHRCLVALLPDAVLVRPISLRLPRMDHERGAD